MELFTSVGLILIGFPKVMGIYSGIIRVSTKGDKFTGLC